MITRAATAVEVSQNAKTGAVSATYAAQVSCPSACPFRGAGCYAESGRPGIATRQLANAADGMTPVDVASAEASAIDNLSGTRPLRLHVVGDCSSDDAARIVSDAAGRYTERGGGIVWTYTHAWRDVVRAAWQSVNVRASVERPEDIAAARERGYRAAIVVDSHESASAYDVDGERIIPCPEQTRGAQCVSCGLCWNSDATIAFAAHGARRAAVVDAIG